MLVDDFYSAHQERRTIRHITMFLYFVAAGIYLAWRTTIFNPEQYLFSLAFYIAEVISFMLALISIFLSWKVKVRKPVGASSGMAVDIFIPTYNETVDMLRLTVMAAMKIRYPHETWLLDDGRREEMKQLADELGCHYLARADNKGNKSGNMNNALQHASGDYICVLDSDHVAQSDLLDKLLGYFNKDDQLAFVQAPQDFYNVSAFQFHNNRKQQVRWQDQQVFYGVGQAGRDYWNAATCCGTGVVFRRQAIDDIGGFPPETVTEDMHMSIRMQKLGYNTAYYPQPVSYGVAPTDYGSFLRQRLRWGQGNVHVWRKECLPWPKGLTWAQSICYSALALLYLEGWARLIFYIVPAMVLLTGIGPISDATNFYYFYIPYFLAMWFHYEEMTRGNMQVFINEQLAMARFPVFIAATFGLFRNRIRWRVTPKNFIGHLPLYLLLPQFAVIALNLTALLVMLINPVDRTIQTYGWQVLSFIAFWCVLNITFAVLVIKQAIKASMLKRPDYRFEIPFPIQLKLNSQVVYGTTSGISADTMEFTLYSSDSINRGDIISGILYPAPGAVDFHARVLGVDRLENQLSIECEFEWSDIKNRDELNLSLHSCDWHRRYVFQGEFFQTPIEAITNFFGITNTRKNQVVNWEPALYKRTDKADAEYSMAMYAPDPESQQDRILVFSPLPLQTEITILLTDHETPKKLHLKATSLLKDNYEPGSGLDDAIAHVYFAEPIEYSNYYSATEAA